MSAFEYSGSDVDGGYALYLAVEAENAYRLSEPESAVEFAPLLCAGIIGYRALKHAELPRGGRLGVHGSGASAHLTAQQAMAQGDPTRPRPFGRRAPVP